MDGKPTRKAGKDKPERRVRATSQKNKRRRISQKNKPKPWKNRTGQNQKSRLHNEQPAL